MENKLIVNRKDRIVIYNSSQKTYEKKVYLTFLEKLKIYLGIKRFPGNNVVKMVQILKENGIKTYDIVSHTKYSYVTKEIEGTTLLEAVIKNKDNKELIKFYMDQYFTIIKKIIELDIYYGDFYFNNFMVDKNNEVYIIDIDEMEKTLYSKIFKNKKMIPRLKKSFTLQLKRLRAKSIDIDFDVNEII